MSLRIFPVAGNAIFSNDWLEPRSGERSHLGNDLFALEGTPLLAVDDGEIHFGSDVLGGNVANLYAVDGVRYYYAHLQGFAGVRRLVRAGEIIGYLGKTGNAATTSPHVHFEVHPGGGEAVNPFSMLTVSQRLPLPIAPKPSEPSRFTAALVAAGAGLLTWWGLSQWKKSK